MKVGIKLIPQKEKEYIKIPINYNAILQAFIYNLFEKNFREFLHNQGYRFEKRNFKLFTFSRLFGKYKIINNKIQFSNFLKFYIASPKSEILENVAKGLLLKDKYFLGKNKIAIDSIFVLNDYKFDDEVIIKMQSPITVYSTLLKSDGKKKTYYYSPFEEEFKRQIRDNIIKKYFILNGKKPKDDFFDISPIKVNPRDEKVILYKKKNKKPTVIKGWMGIYKLRGLKELIKIAYDCGLGAKNSLGFGCWKMVEKDNFN